MNQCYFSVMNEINTNNYTVEENAHALFGKPSENKKDEVNRIEMIKTYIDLNRWEIIDPINLKELKETLNKEVEDFLAEVDSVLTESNAVTEIEISKNPQKI